MENCRRDHGRSAVLRVVEALLATGLLIGLSGAVNAQLQQCNVGDRVAMPSGSGKWLDAVVIAVNPADKASCKVHPLGYTPYMDSFIRPAGLRAPGSVKMEPIGGIVGDPYLLAAQGRTAFKPTSVVPGTYECATFTDKHLEARPALNFTILSGTKYRDAFGAAGSYSFDTTSGGLVFQGGALSGQRGTYKQASNPPVKTQPPEFDFDISHDGCTLAMR
jgi:hypothetical protein